MKHNNVSGSALLSEPDSGLNQRPVLVVVEPLLVTVDIAAGMLDVHRTVMFELLRDPDARIESLLVGPRTRRVVVASLRDYVARKAAESRAQGAA